MASGVDAAVLLAGFGLPVAPFVFRHGMLEEPSNDIEAVLAMFSRRTEALVGYNSCDAPFYVLLTDCVRSFRSKHPHIQLSLMSGGFSRALGIRYRLTLASPSNPAWRCSHAN
jgi:hypothetical protein